MSAVDVSDAANADLDGIYDYGAEQFGEVAAEAYLRRFNGIYDLIRDFPLSGMVQDRVRPAIRSLPCGSHRVYYDVEGGHAIVRRVLHKAVDVERHL